MVNSHRLVEVTADKWTTYNLLRENGVNVPPSTIEFDPDHLERFGRENGFPVVVKPRRGKGSVGVVECSDLDSLVAHMGQGGPMMAQRHIGDRHHEYTVGVLGSETGDILGTIVLRRYLQEGITCAAEVVDYPEVAKSAQDVARLLKPRGYLNVQLRLDNGRPSVIEVNGRVSSSTSFRAVAGFNEPEILIRYYLLGEKELPVSVRPIKMVRAREVTVVDPGRWRRLLEDQSDEFEFVRLTRQWTMANWPRIKELSRDLSWDYWQREHFLLDLPAKWDLSFWVNNGREIVGYVIASLKENWIWLHRVVMAANYRNQGRGRQVLNHLENRCHEFSAQGVRLKVASDNPEAISFYSREGFREYGVEGTYHVFEKKI